jgi:glycine oxidase
MRSVPRSSDIVVIGAGVVGCAIGLELVRRGASVSILDARAPGEGSTQAAGGMLAPYSEVADAGPLLTLAARSLELFDRFVCALEAESGVTLGYERTGTLHVARSAGTVATFQTTARDLTARGVAVEILSAAEARAAEVNLAPEILGGMLIPSQGLIAASEMTRAMVVAARRRGATLLDPARAVRIRPNEGAVTIETELGRLHAGSVVLAAGAWSGQIAIDGVAVAVPIKPLRGQLLHLGWSSPPLSRITWDEGCYVVPRRDGTVLVGATVEDVGFDERNTAAGVRQLLEAVCTLLPNAATASLRSARVGLRPGSPDSLPVIGWSEVVPQLMYATGHYRNGILLAPLTAQLVADAMVTGVVDPALESTRPARFGRL